MPRTNVPRGSVSNRPCSSASSWRGANFSCCATSASARPASSRALASSAPMPLAASFSSVSVKLPPLQRLVLGRSRVAASKLVREALLGHTLAGLALDAQREPERLGVRCHHLVVARDEAPRLVHLALAVADRTELEQRGRLVGLELERPLEKILRVLRVLGAKSAHARCRVRAPRHRVQGVAGRLLEVADRVLLAAGVAQEQAEVVVDVRIARRQAQGALEVALGELVLLQLHVHQAEHAVGRRVARVGGAGGAQLVERDRHAAAVEILGGELGMQARAVARIAHLARDLAGLDLRPVVLGRASREQREKNQRPPHARTSLTAMSRRCARRVRSATSPASSPQAAAMSSPRVLRAVTVTPACCSTAAKRRMRSSPERSNPERGKGLNGIRLYLQRTSREIAASSRAC